MGEIKRASLALVFLAEWSSVAKEPDSFEVEAGRRVAIEGSESGRLRRCCYRPGTSRENGPLMTYYAVKKRASNHFKSLSNVNQRSCD